MAVLPALIAISMQDYIAVYFIGAGFSWLLTGRGKLGTLSMLLGCIYFFGVVKLVMPAMSVRSLWEPLGESMTEILLSPFYRPGVFWQLVLQSGNLHLLVILLLPMCLMPLLAPRFLIALLPIVLFNCLRPAAIAKSIAFQYQTGTIGILFLAAAIGITSTGNNDRCIPILSGLVKRINRRIKPGALICASIAVSLVGSLYIGLLPWSRSGNNAIIPNAEKLELNYNAFQDIRSLVPANATVTGDDRTMAMFLDHRLVLKYDTRTSIETDYHVYQERAFGAPVEEARRLVDNTLATGNYRLIYNQNGCYVLQRNEPLPPLPDHIF